MPLLRKYVLFACCYLFIGVAVLYTHYLQTSPYQKDALDEKLTLVAASHFSLPQLVDNLPTVFRENSHAAALKLTNFKGEFLGAMYDARRMRSDEYRQFLDTKSFTVQKSPLIGYEILIWESKGRKLRIVALSLSRAKFSAYLGAMSNTYALHYLIPIYVLFGGLLLFMYHWFWGSESHSRHLFSEKKKRLPFFAPAKTTVDSAAALSPTEPKHRWQLKSGVIAEGGIHATLAQLRSLAGAESVRLFAKLNNQWLPVAEVRGQLTVRGEAMELPSLLTQPFASTEEFLFDTVYGECLAFNKAPQNAELCFVLKLNSTKEIAESEMRERIGTFVKTHSRSLLVEHYYESSILDAESGLYSFPYAMFTLKEKILGGLTFSAAVFQFPESFFTSSHLSKIARTAIRAMREYFAADEAPVIARGSGNRLFIIFNARREGAKDYAEEATLKLFTSYENIFKTEFQLQAGFVADAAGFGSSTRAIKILERLLDESSSTKKLAVYKVQSYSNII